MLHFHHVTNFFHCAGASRDLIGSDSPGLQEASHHAVASTLHTQLTHSAHTLGPLAGTGLGTVSMGFTYFWNKIRSPEFSRFGRARQRPPARSLSSRMRARVSQAVRGKHARRNPGNNPGAVAQGIQTPDEHVTNREEVSGDFPSSDSQMAPGPSSPDNNDLNGMALIPTIVIHPPSLSDRASETGENTVPMKVHFAIPEPNNSQELSDPVANGNSSTHYANFDPQSDDEQVSVPSFDEDNVDTTPGKLRKVPIINPLRISRTSVPRSEMAILDYSETPVEGVARQVTITPGRSLISMINQLRDNESCFEFDISGSSQTSNSFLTEPSRFSSFAEDATNHIDRIIEMYSSLTDLTVPNAGDSEASSTIASWNHPSTTSPSLNGDVIDPSMKPAVPNTKEASRKDEISSPSATNPIPSPLRWPTRVDSLTFGSARPDLTGMVYDQDILAAMKEPPPPIPERSPARLKPHVNLEDLLRSTTGMQPISAAEKGTGREV